MNAMATAWTTADLGDQTGRVAVVTGANSGLGLETARELARAGATVVMCSRDPERGREALDDVRTSWPRAAVELQLLDLASLEGIRRAADEVGERHERIDLLVNNAGVMFTPRRTTADGFELQFGTNHLGHFAWTGLLLDRLLPVPGSRVVTVSSVGHRIRPKLDFDDLQSERRYDRVAAYGRSKLANLMFTYALQRRLERAGAPTAALAAHPGVSDTELARWIPGAGLFRPMTRLVAQSAARGALPTLRAAADPSAVGGQYYGPDGLREWRGDPVVVGSSGPSRHVGAQDRLWEVSSELTGVTYPV